MSGNDPNQLLQSYRENNDCFVDEQRRSQIRYKLEMEPLLYNQSKVIDSQKVFNNHEKGNASPDYKQINNLKDKMEEDETAISQTIFSNSFAMYNKYIQEPKIKEDFQKERQNLKQSINENLNNSSFRVFYKNLVIEKKNYQFGMNGQEKQRSLSQISQLQSESKRLLDTSTDKSIQSQQQQQQLKDVLLTEPPYQQEKEPRFDFKKLNNIPKKLKQQTLYKDRLVGNLPQGIEEISKLKDQSEDTLLRPQNLSEFIYDLKQTQKGPGAQNDPLDPKDLIENERAHAVYEDYIESYSNAQNKLKNFTPMHFYRDMAPIARELSQKNEKVLNVHDCAENELLEENEYKIEFEKPKFEDLLNISSGRLANPYLNQILRAQNKLIQQQQTIQNQNSQQQQYPNQQSSQNILLSNLNMGNNNNNNFDATSISDISFLSYLNNIELEENQANIDQLNKKKEEIHIKKKVRPVTSEEIQTEQFLNKESPTKQNQMELQRSFAQNLHVKTQDILNEINMIKGMKSNVQAVNNSAQAIILYKQINNKLEEKLVELLSVVLCEDGAVLSAEEVRSNLKSMLQQVEKLQGVRTPDGHLKTKLLFQFLSEYKQLQADKERILNIEEGQQQQMQKIAFNSNINNSNGKTDNANLPVGVLNNRLQFNNQPVVDQYGAGQGRHHYLNDSPTLKQAENIIQAQSMKSLRGNNESGGNKFNNKNRLVMMQDAKKYKENLQQQQQLKEQRMLRNQQTSTNSLRTQSRTPPPKKKNQNIVDKYSDYTNKKYMQYYQQQQQISMQKSNSNRKLHQQQQSQNLDSEEKKWIGKEDPDFHIKWDKIEANSYKQNLQNNNNIKNNDF